MPTYTYKCECKHEWEEVQRIKDPPVEACPKCGGKPRRKIFAPGIIYKGAGFYTTDHKRMEEHIIERDTRKDQVKVHF